MDLVSWVLTFAIVIFMVFLVVNTGRPLYRYRKAKDRIVKLDGIISSYYGEEIVVRKGNKIVSFYPVYSCTIDKKERTLNGAVKYFGQGSSFIGHKAVLLYDKETKELWSERDLPMMKKQIIQRILLMLTLVAVMILTNVML